jgi:ATP-binding cassette subfamily B (MDR/TAP) protein 1
MTITTPKDGGKVNKMERMLTLLRPRGGKGTWEIPGSSYVALFRPLHDTQSRLILISGILLSIAAGVPLPIIGVIFARIINAFPPSEEEIRSRITQLLIVGECYFWPIST